MAAALDYVYRYPFSSALDTHKGDRALKLATFTAGEQSPYFFEGKMAEPVALTRMFLVLSDIVRTHFFMPLPEAALDPVFTSNDSALRMEGFSACCGVYARIDMQPDAFGASVKSRGTTNVDFNDPMRAALRTVAHGDSISLAVGRDEVAMDFDAQRVVEKKVKLPLRWVKGFGEVQAFQTRLVQRFEIPAPAALRLLRSLPATNSKSTMFVTGSDRAPRITVKQPRDGVAFKGAHRVTVLMPLLAMASSLRVYEDPQTGASAWEVVTDAARFLLVISPEPYRAFSGEGQLLAALGGARQEQFVSEVRSQLLWQNEIDTTEVAETLGVGVEAVEQALAALSARGCAGYDVNTRAYFHRELPFDFERVEAMQPRLKSARKLIEAGGLSVRGNSANGTEVLVPGTDVMHVVTLSPDGDQCTCPWYAKHQQTRGPCKHILAAQLLVEAEAES